MSRALAVMIVAALLGAATASGATAPVCQNIPLPDRLEATPIAFVGKLDSRSERDGAIYWRFEVDQKVKGPIGPVVDIRAPRLTDSTGKPLDFDSEVGVLAELDGATIVTDTCSLTDPAALLSVADEAKGGAIKLVMGFMVLAAVLVVCWVRIRRGSRPNFPGLPNDPGARAKEAREQ